MPRHTKKLWYVKRQYSVQQDSELNNRLNFAYRRFVNFCSKFKFANTCTHYLKGKFPYDDVGNTETLKSAEG
jgi:hypothetical protein